MNATAIGSCRDGRGIFQPGAAASCASAGGGHAVAGPGWPVVVLAAAVLAADDVSLLLVGSVALFLRGEPVSGRCGRGDRAQPRESAPPARGAGRRGLAATGCPGAAPARRIAGRHDRDVVWAGRLPVGTRPPGLGPAVALAAERGEIAPVPVGLITGNAYQWGL